MNPSKGIRPVPPSKGMVKYWLMKSELDVYPYSQLVADGTTHWDGVRNYQARTMMRDDMKMGDLVLFYHSNHKPPHIAGIARVCKEGYPDFTAQDTNSKYFDEKANPEKNTGKVKTIGIKNFKYIVGKL